MAAPPLFRRAARAAAAGRAHGGTSCILRQPLHLCGCATCDGRGNFFCLAGSAISCLPQPHGATGNSGT